MTKILLKKQLMEVFSWAFADKKKNKKRSKIGVIFLSFIFFACFAVLAVVFYKGAEFLCTPLVAAGFSWLYIALVMLVAVAIGVFGSVFGTYSSLYCSKDNDFLLSMPIPPRKIILARLATVLLTTVIYEFIVIIPATAVWFVCGKTSSTQIIFTLLVAVCVTLFAVSLSCMLGWAISLVLLRVKRKNLITVIFTLIFIAVYYYVYYNAYSILQSILANPAAVGEKIKSVLFFFYHLGLAADGKAVSLLISVGVTALFLIITFMLASKSFLGSATTNVGSAKGSKKASSIKSASLSSALLRKEFRRFTGSANYMLNCALGTLFMPVVSVVLLFNADFLKTALAVLSTEQRDIVALIACGLLCMLICMNDITAPSISLEGKSLWIYKSLPVKATHIFAAKVKLHLYLTLPVMYIFALCALIIIKPSALMWLLVLLIGSLFSCFMALAGLAINLKAPKLDWTNDVVPIKQSLSVTLALFGGWAAVAVLGALYWLTYKFLSAAAFLAVIAFLLALSCALLCKWLKNRGSVIFSNL